jgi:hypothetical protein
VIIPSTVASSLVTEADVEQKVVYPLLQDEHYLDLPLIAIHTKEYLRPTTLDKAAGKTSGYFPDVSVWIQGLLVMIVEVKAPDVPAETGYREASLYARHINQSYRSGLNPCRYIFASNGNRLLFGHWDAMPTMSIDLVDLKPHTAMLDQLREQFGRSALERHASICVSTLRTERAERPFQLAGGVAILTAKKALNTFAADLSPLLRRYFSSTTQLTNRELIRRAYVSTDEVTEYDRVLESLLKDRAEHRSTSIVQNLRPTRRGEKRMTKAITKFGEERPEEGQLQIIQGAVGSGKSLFIRRFKELLQPAEQAKRTRWTFVDFNGSPPSLDHPDAQKWLCEKLISSFEQENPTIDLSAPEVLRGVFSRNIQRRRAIYDDVALSSPEQAALLRARDLAGWQENPLAFFEGLSTYIMGAKREILVAVLDNVDKLELKSQLDAFQLAMWLLDISRSFVVIQMRDETFERFKNRPPLDTFRSNITFHIAPPRFIDVVKRRLELGIAFLAETSPEAKTYTLDNGARIKIPSSDIGAFLHALYQEIFGSNRNISRVLESIAGLDVRKALDMFASIITSGHLSTSRITSSVRGGREFPITEVIVLKILMRTEYRLFSEVSGFITNLFYFDTKWEKPDNFILIECLFYLAINRTVVGQIGIEGYFTCRHVSDALQLMGYVPEDTLCALNYLLNRQLISADHMRFTEVGFDDAIRILASGFMHIRILPDRLQYCFGVISVTPIVDPVVAVRLSNYIEREITRDDLSEHDQTLAVEVLYNYLLKQLEFRRGHTPFSGSTMTGAEYVLDRILDGISAFWNNPVKPTGTGNILDVM